MLIRCAGRPAARSAEAQDPMADVRLLVLDRTAWKRVAEDPAVFAVEQALTLRVEPDLLRTVGQQTLVMLERTGATSPWTGYLGVDRAQQIIIGTCAFTAPPDPEGVVEIAYFTFPPFERAGYGTAMAAALVAVAEGAAAIRRVRAHTLPEGNASTRILEKLGFERIGDAIDPEVGQVWRWERRTQTGLGSRNALASMDLCYCAVSSDGTRLASAKPSRLPAQPNSKRWHAIGLAPQSVGRHRIASGRGRIPSRRTA